jgi:regulation of enolase protein 1 (concanavalin A-like superfamily)
VYFEDLETPVSAGQVEETYDLPALELDKTYVWRVDECNIPGCLRGRVWSFSTPEYLVVDDFEDYNDYSPDRIYDTWKDGYDVPANGSQIGYDPPPIAESDIVHGGSQSTPFFYNNTSPVTYSEAERTFDTPQDWTANGVKALTLWFRGDPATGGSFSHDPAADIYIMTGRGTDIWDVPDFPGTGEDPYHDEFHYAYKLLSGDGSIVAQVISVQNTDPGAKAGLMIRETLEANSVHGMVVVTPGNGVAFERRDRTGKASSRFDPVDVTAPQWVRLSRTGHQIRAEYSSDGSTWESFSTRNIRMASDVYIGLVLTSANADSTCMATFSDVTTTGTGQWQSQDIGVPKNVAEQLYVALEDSTGTRQLVNHPDADVVLSDTWQPWDIALSEFGDAGVDIQNVKKIAFGVGDRANPKSGPTGTLYFDDISLYPSRCLPDIMKPAGDLNNDCRVDYLDILMMSGDWLLPDYVIATSDPGSSDLLVEYTFNSNDLTDTSGNNYHGVGLNGPSVHDGILTLQGTNFVDIPLGGNNPFDGSKDFSIAMDFRIDQPSVLISSSRPDYVDGSLTVYVAEVEEPSEMVCDNRNIGWLGTGTHPILDGEWHHMVTTYDAATEVHHVYVDSFSEIWASGDGVYDPNIPDINLDTVRIGSAYSPDAYDMGASDFIGDIVNVRIYSRALTAAEVAYLSDDTPGDGQLYFPVPSPANLYDGEPPLSRSVNLMDLAELADSWLDEQLWP